MITRFACTNVFHLFGRATAAKLPVKPAAVAITKDLSRLGRNSALTGLYTNFTFPQNGVRFIAINDNYDTIDPNRVDNDFAGISVIPSARVASLEMKER